MLGFDLNVCFSLKNDWEAEMTGDFGTILAPLGFVSSWQMVPGVQEYDKKSEGISEIQTPLFFRIITRQTRVLDE